MWGHGYVVTSLVGVQSATHTSSLFLLPNKYPYGFRDQFCQQVVALMNVLAARRKKLIPIEKGTDPTLSH